MPPKPPQEPKKNPLREAARYSGIAFEMVATIGGFIWLGIYLDGRSDPPGKLWTVCLALVGVGLALYLVIKHLPKSK